MLCVCSNHGSLLPFLLLPLGLLRLEPLDLFGTLVHLDRVALGRGYLELCLDC